MGNKRIEITIDENKVDTRTENVTGSDLIQAIAGLIMTTKDITGVDTLIVMADVQGAIDNMEKHDTGPKEEGAENEST